MTAVKRIEENIDVRERMQALEQAMTEMEPLEIEPSHHFADGMYVRELFMPAGSLITSKIHKTEHFALIVKGAVTVAQEDGLRYIEAPYMTITKPGTKRALYVHEDTIWITFHPTDKTDVEEIEAEIIAEDFDALVNMGDEKCLGSQ